MLKASFREKRLWWPLLPSLREVWAVASTVLLVAKASEIRWVALPKRGECTSRYTAKRDASIGIVCEADHEEWCVSSAFRAAAKERQNRVMAQKKDSQRCEKLDNVTPKEKFL